MAFKKVFIYDLALQKCKDEMRKDEYSHPHRINMANGSLKDSNREVRERYSFTKPKVGEVYKNLKKCRRKSGQIITAKSAYSLGKICKLASS